MARDEYFSGSVRDVVLLFRVWREKEVQRCVSELEVFRKEMNLEKKKKNRGIF